MRDADSTAAEQGLEETSEKDGPVGVTLGVSQKKRTPAPHQKPPLQRLNERAEPEGDDPGVRQLSIGIARAEAQVSWEEVAAHLAEAKVAALGARLADLRAKAVVLGVAKPKVLGRGAEINEPVAEEAAEPRAPNVADELLTTSDVAALLKIARSTVEAIPTTELPFVPVGRGTKRLTRRYRPEDVDAYVTRQCARTAKREEQKQEQKEWERVASSASRAVETGTCGSTTPSNGGSTGSRHTRPTKTSLGNAWLKLRGS